MFPCSFHKQAEPGGSLEGPCIQKDSSTKSTSTSVGQFQEASIGMGRWAEREGRSLSPVQWLESGFLLQILGAALTIC